MSLGPERLCLYGRSGDRRACRDAGDCPGNGADTAERRGNDRGKHGEGEVKMHVLLKLWGCAIGLAICVAWLAHRPAEDQSMSHVARPIEDPAKLIIERQRERARQR